jgi:hypothetical protein
MQVESAGEHRTPLQQRLFRVIEVVVGPGHRVAQRVVAFQSATRPDQQPESLIETITHFARRHRRHPRGGQLDRQREPIKAAANLHHCRRLVRVAQREARGHAVGAFDEQRRCGRVDARAHVEGGHEPQLFVGDLKPFAAGGHDPHRRGLRQDRLDQIGRGVAHMLAIIEHQQPDSPLQRGSHTVGQALSRLLDDAQRRRHRIGHRRRIGHRGQFEKPDPVGELVGQLRCELHRQAGLADPTHPGQSHQAMSLHRGLNLGDLGLAPDKARSRRPQIARTRIERPQCRKVSLQAHRSDLKHTDRGGQIPQPSRPQIDQVNSAEQTRRRLGQKDLTAVPGGHHPRRAIQHRTEVIRLPQLSFAGCDPHPDRQLEFPLRGHCGIDRRPRRGERGTHTIAGVLEQEAAVRLDRRTQHLVMSGERRPHPIGVGLPPTRRTLHIGEQKRHDTRRRDHRGHPHRMSQGNGLTSCIAGIRPQTATPRGTG